MKSNSNYIMNELQRRGAFARQDWSVSTLLLIKIFFSSLNSSDTLTFCSAWLNRVNKVLLEGNISGSNTAALNKVFDVFIHTDLKASADPSKLVLDIPQLASNKYAELSGVHILQIDEFVEIGKSTKNVSTLCALDSDEEDDFGLEEGNISKPSSPQTSQFNMLKVKLTDGKQTVQAFTYDMSMSCFKVGQVEVGSKVQLKDVPYRHGHFLLKNSNTVFIGGSVKLSSPGATNTVAQPPTAVATSNHRRNLTRQVANPQATAAPPHNPQVNRSSSSFPSNLQTSYNPQINRSSSSSTSNLQTNYVPQISGSSSSSTSNLQTNYNPQINRSSSSSTSNLQTNYNPQINRSSSSSTSNLQTNYNPQISGSSSSSTSSFQTNRNPQTHRSKMGLSASADPKRNIAETTSRVETIDIVSDGENSSPAKKAKVNYKSYEYCDLSEAVSKLSQPGADHVITKALLLNVVKFRLKKECFSLRAIISDGGSCHEVQFDPNFVLRKYFNGLPFIQAKQRAKANKAEIQGLLSQTEGMFHLQFDRPSNALIVDNITKPDIEYFDYLLNKIK